MLKEDLMINLLDVCNVHGVKFLTSSKGFFKASDINNEAKHGKFRGTFNLWSGRPKGRSEKNIKEEFL